MSVQDLEEVNTSPYDKFALQFDESTDVRSCFFYWTLFVTFDHHSDVKEEFLLCENLTTTTKGVDVFNIVSGFLEKNGLDWNSVHQVSVDGMPAMIGGQSGFRGFVQRENADIAVDHALQHSPCNFLFIT